MDKSTEKAAKLKQKRAMRVRAKLHGTNQKPRLSIIKSNKHIYAQLIDDESGKTMGAISTNKADIRKTENGKKNKQSARFLGTQIADMAKKLGISQVVFDRGPFKFHGILAELATGVRENGIQC